jgi:RHS repeat-associated protein
MDSDPTTGGDTDVGYGSAESDAYEYTGERAIITLPDGTIIRRFFFGYEEIDYPVEDTESISHYFVNGQRIASRSSATGLQYLHTDHLGSATRATDEHGAIIWDALYSPYGEFIYFDNNSNMEYGYTGQEQDSTDWYYYGARYYSPESGRFLQPDPLFDGPNPYMYVHGNPVRYVDPSGLFHGLLSILVD